MGLRDAQLRVQALLHQWAYPLLCSAGIGLLFLPLLLFSYPVIINERANPVFAYWSRLTAFASLCIFTGVFYFFLTLSVSFAEITQGYLSILGIRLRIRFWKTYPENYSLVEELRAVAVRICSFWWVIPATLLGCLAAKLFSASPAFSFTCGLLLVAAVVLVHAFMQPIDDEPQAEQNEVIRGTTISTYDLARQRSKAACEGQPFTIRWAGLDLPAQNENHFACIGITRSGKSLQLQDLMRSVLKTLPLDGVAASRVLIFDPESKYVPMLHELVGEDNVIITNPFDRRSRPWDIAKEITSPAVAAEMAEIFIPKQEHAAGEPFWQRAAATIVGSLIRALNEKASKGWTMRQFFHLFTKQRLLQIALTDAQESNDLFNLLRQNNRTLVSVLAEILTHMEKLRIIAALWDASVTKYNAKPFTLDEWLQKNSRKVFLFGRPAEIEENILAVNRVIIKRLTQLIRSFPTHDDSIGQSWVFLDELPTLGNLDGLSRLLTEGASRKVRVVIAFQDIADMRKAYKDKETPEVIANQCSHTSYFKCNGETAKWASSRLGQSEHWKTTTNAHTSVTQGDNPTSSQGSGSSETQHIDDAVLASELSGLPEPEKATQDGGVKGAIVRGWHIIPQLKLVCEAFDNDVFYPFDPIPKPGEAFQPRPTDDQKLRDWDDARDWEEMGWQPANRSPGNIDTDLFGAEGDDDQ